VAGLIMRYGSMTIFWEALVDSCEKARAIQSNLRNVKIGYYLSVWEKERKPMEGRENGIEGI